MITNDNHIKKLAGFYLLLPEDTLRLCLEKMNINRKARRILDQKKKLKDKVNLVILAQDMRHLFADAAYQLIKDRVPLTLEEASYEDIYDGITDENKLDYTVFFFRWCYEKDANGTFHDKLYFDTFFHSRKFQRILQKQDPNAPEEPPVPEITEVPEEPPIPSVTEVSEAPPVSEVTEVPEKPPIPEPDAHNDNPVPAPEPLAPPVTADTTPVHHQTTTEVPHMKLLGRIEKNRYSPRTTFYNFFPQYRIDGDTISLLDYIQLKHNYPGFGGIYLDGGITGDCRRFLDNLNAGNDSIYPQSAYIVEFEEDELKENLKSDNTLNTLYEKKLDLQALIERGERLSDRIRPAGAQEPAQGAAYKVVTSETDEILPQTFAGGNIFLRESDRICDGEQVVLSYQGKYYGPLTAHYRAMDNRAYVQTGAATHNYLVNYFLPYHVSPFDLHKYNKDDQQYYYVRFIYVTKDPLEEDIITDDILLEKLAEDVSLDLARQNPEEFSHLCSNSPFFANLSQATVDSRMKRIHDLIENIGNYQAQQDKLFEALLKLFKDNPPKSFDDAVKDSGLYQETAKEAQRATAEAKRADAAEKRVQELQDELEQLHQAEDNTTGTVSAEKAAEYQSMEEELQRYRSLSHDIDALTKQKDRLEQDVDSYIRMSERYRDRALKERDGVVQAIEQGSERMAKIAFDPFIANKMIKAAASFDEREEKEDYQKLCMELSKVTPSALSGDDLIDYIVEYVQKRRNYSRNEIINIYISLAQSFITIFSGEPGTGKTSMGDIIAETLGLLQYGENINRFVTVSVERGWSSKRDFIGYYNPLTRRYDKNNAKVYNALQILDKERQQSAYPFVMLLDEANLSPIEYYWADFMRLTDRSSENDAYINIGTEKELYVPETLRFVATINTDQTTETLSPRLIDRASIIKLPKVAPKTNLPTDALPKELISWQALSDTFNNCRGEIPSITQNALKVIYKLFNDYGMNVSARLQLCIKNYILAAQAIMEDETDTLAREKALDFAIVQKLLPKINGYYTVYERFFDALKQACQEYNLKMTEEAVNKLIDAQENNMGYCQYLI